MDPFDPAHPQYNLNMLAATSVAAAASWASGAGWGARLQINLESIVTYKTMARATP
jgi:hypothetical protein